MAEITTLSIPHALIERARALKINCSEVARDAIKARIDKLELALVDALVKPENGSTGSSDEPAQPAEVE